MKNLHFIKDTFINQFRKLYKQFRDSRELFFTENNDIGKFPHNLFKEDVDVQANWTEEIIEIRFNDEILKREIINNSEWNNESIKKMFKEIANHEYGHTLTLDNIFLLFPQDTRHILLNKKLEDITMDDLTKSFAESTSYYHEFFKLKNIELNFFEHIFLDFWANLKVRNEIDENPPEECLKERQNGFFGLRPEVINRKSFLKLLLYSQLFLIYDKWYILEEILRDNDLDQLLLLYKSINVFFNKIIELNDNFDSMEEDLVELAKNLDRFNYKDIILNNRLNNQDKGKLKAFIGRLKEKEE